MHCRPCQLILPLKSTRLSAQVEYCCFILTRICSKSKSMAQSRSYLRPCVGLVLNKRSSPPPPLSPCIGQRSELRWNRKSKLGKNSAQVKQEIQTRKEVNSGETGNPSLRPVKALPAPCLSFPFLARVCWAPETQMHQLNLTLRRARS